MFRHPHYLDIPWDIRWEHEAGQPHHHLWWLIAALVVLAMFLIGVEVVGGIG